jgi:hypothetical protein
VGGAEEEVGRQRLAQQPFRGRIVDAKLVRRLAVERLGACRVALGLLGGL